VALPESEYYVGIDWGSEEHAVCVLDHAGHAKAQFTIRHTADGFTRLTARLARYGSSEDIPVGIERPGGRLVDLLLETGHPVVPAKTRSRKPSRACPNFPDTPKSASMTSTSSRSQPSATASSTSAYCRSVDSVLSRTCTSVLWRK
jgi:hypothetical protein